MNSIGGNRGEVFLGTYTHSLDSKGRISLPSPFRQVLTEILENKVVLTNYISDGARCLEGFSGVAWNELLERMRNKSRFDPQVQRLENYYLARASMSEVDSSGRILIPTHLRQYAGLQKKVVFTAAVKGFRLWAEHIWEMVFQEAESTLLENPSMFQGVD